VRIVAEGAFPLFRGAVLELVAEDLLRIVAFEAQGLQVFVISDPEEQCAPLSSVGGMAVGAILRGVVKRRRRIDQIADFFVAIDAEFGRFGERERVQVLLGHVTFLALSDRGHVRPVGVAVFADIGVALVGRAGSGGLDRLRRLPPARGMRRYAKEHQHCEDHGTANRVRRPRVQFDTSCR